MDYLGILDFSPVAQFAIDREHKIVRWNRACEIMTGYPAKEMVGTDLQWKPFYPSKRPMLADIVLEQDGRGFLKYYRGSKLIRSRAVSNAWEKTEFFSNLGGRSRNIRFLAAPVPEAGHYVGAVETLIDVTEESNHEKALIQSMEDYRALAEDLSDGFVLVQGGRYVFVNNAYAKMLGYSDPGFFIGKRAEEFISPALREEFTKKNIAISHGHVREKHLRWPHVARDGREVWIEGHPKLITWGNKPTVLSTLIDVTEAMNRETAIKEEASRLRRQVKSLKASMKERYRFGEIIGKSAPMQEVYELITKAAARDANVIIYGESGTGKELVARAIHDRSSRKKGNFVPVNCSAIPETLMESEFFGYKKGAFTGAQVDKRGYLDQANGGTLFLDEIGELSPDIQAKLLRAIEGHGYTPIGTTESRNSDFRIIAATHKNLVEQVQLGRTREDFFYRIHIVPIDLPPLRSRKEDIPLLVDHFIRSYDTDGKITPLPGDVMKVIYDYDWPGNVRELQNAIHRFITIGRLDLVDTRKCDTFTNPGEKDSGSRTGTLKGIVKSLEKEMICEALRQGKGNKTKAAALLGIPRKTLYRKLVKVESK
ncbi:MAG: sigma-54-dependent Fis family transcriptional regulator [Deltaproteobacteria bacterium HGW-Deltaproteobacteria-21]|nr:MAG: sigma-54-dependent Fis family transcriptional regulator [Deltaproteobacteria bacterium HGW-Deltaproteobacteria-21]